jgi:quinol monooxygenase YgiN
MPAMRSAVILVGEIFGLAGPRDELTEVMLRAQREARQAEGCRRFAFARSLDDPDVVLVAQEWSDEAALERHFRSPAHGAYQRDVEGLLARPSEVRIHHVAQTVQPGPPTEMDPRRAD